MPEVFISYKSDDEKIALEIVKYLEQNGRKCWISCRDVGECYAGDIVEAISQCKVFLLLLSKKAITNGTHILNELEQAYKYFTEEKMTIIPVHLEKVTYSNDMDYYIHRIQHVDASETILFDAEVEILSRIDKALGGYVASEVGKVNTTYVDRLTSERWHTSNKNIEQTRVSNRYYDVDDKYEKRRLKIEGRMLLPYEKDILDNYLLKDCEHLKGLIVCCMNVHGVMDKFNLDQFDSIIGLCYNEKATFEANYDFKSDKCKFFWQDAEDENFEEKLEEYMEERGIDKFDYMDITMGFLDWKNPFKVVKSLKRYMAKGCRIFVRDIDDKVLLACPDEKDLFKKFFTFYPIDPIAGYRVSGRRVFSYFKKIGATSIKLMKKGIDSTDMDYDQKQDLFHAYFGFIPNDFRICYNEHPDKKEYKEIIEWCDQYFNDLEEEFMNDDFFYNSGYFLYAIKM